jgi:hypothetical protein
MTKMAVFWVVAPCSLVEVYQRFRCPCCLHHQGDDDHHQTTRRYNPEGSHLRTHRREKLKSYLIPAWNGGLQMVSLNTGHNCLSPN